MSTLQGVLVLALGHATTDLDRWRILQKDLDTGNLGHLLTQFLDHAVGIQRPLLARLQSDHQPPRIAHGGKPGRPGRRHERLHLRFPPDHLGNSRLMLDHGLEGDALGCFGRSGDLAGVLAGNEIFGNDDEKISRNQNEQEGKKQRGALMPQNPLQTLLVGPPHPFVEVLRGGV